MTGLPLSPACIGWGAFTALGPTARHTGFYLRAGRNNFTGSPFVDAVGEPVVLSSSTILPKNLQGSARLLALGAGALGDALGPLAEPLRGQRIRVCLCLPNHLAGADGKQVSAEGREVVDGLLLRAGPDLGSAHVLALPFGAGAGARAMTLASQWLGAGEADVVIVCGLDSAYDWRVLERLQRQDRVLTPDNIDGLRPGEAAACLVFVAPHHALVQRLAASRLLAAGEGVEPNPVGSEQPNMAVGLSEALREAVMPLRTAGARCNAWFCDLTHENYRVREFQILLARFGDVAGFDMRFATPARDLGDVGAATLPLYAALATEAWHRGYAADETALCFAGSESGLCGALLLQGTRPRTP